MMSFFLTLLLMLGVIVIMSVGVLFGRKPVQGSCGGMNNIDGLKECEICGGKPEACENFEGETPQVSDAMKPYARIGKASE